MKIFFALKPGLSFYKDDAVKAGVSLIPLMERAKSKVPKSLYGSTPVVLRATAGLRMIGEESSNNILIQVRQVLESSGFRFDNGNEWARILSGNEEAIYSWMTVNHLLGRDADNSVGTLEMGGGSAQIAYIPDKSYEFKNEGVCNVTSETEAITYNEQKLKLYTKSHLDYGLQKARSIVLKRFKDGKKLADNPCFNRGSTPIEVTVPFEEPAMKVSFNNGLGDYKTCADLILQLFIDPSLGSSACKCGSCTYHGHAQPPSIKEYIAFAFYLERTVAIGMNSVLSIDDIDRKGTEICSMSVDEVKQKYPKVPNGLATDLCMDIAYISLHLQRGHGILSTSDTKLRVVDKINDFELGWCLGAMQQTMGALYSSKSASVPSN